MSMYKSDCFALFHFTNNDALKKTLLCLDTLYQDEVISHNAKIALLAMIVIYSRFSD